MSTTEIPKAWIIDLQAIDGQTPSDFGRACHESLTSIYPDDSVLTILGQLTNEKDLHSDIRWFSTERVEQFQHDAGFRRDGCDATFVLVPQGCQEAFSVALRAQTLRVAEGICVGGERAGRVDLCEVLGPVPDAEPLSLALRRIVLIAQWIATRRNVTIFTPDPTDDDKPPESWSFFLEAYSSFNGMPDHNSFDGLKRYVLSSLGTEVFGFHPKQDDKNRVPIASLRDTRVTESWDERSRCTYDDIYYHWFRQEFGTCEIGEIFTRACVESLCRDEDDAVAYQPQVLLPMSVQHAVGIARMCRRLSTWSLEGVPFSCTIVVLPGRVMDSLQGSSSLGRLIDLRPLTPFNLKNQDAVRRHAELAQSEGLNMLVSAADGCLHAIGLVRSAEDTPSREMRHKFYRWLANSHSLVFDIRPHGRVNLYGGGRLILEHDGFEWSKSPHAWLEDKIRDYFEQTDPNALSSSMSPGQASRLGEKLGEAARHLVEKSESSIIVLLDSRDSSQSKRLASETLRPEVRWAFTEKVSLSNLDSETLAGLLHLDGAHLVSRGGYVISISRRISDRPNRHDFKITSQRQADKLRAWINGDVSPGEADKHRSNFAVIGSAILNDHNEDFGTLRVYKRIHRSVYRSLQLAELLEPDLDKLFADQIRNDTPPMLAVAVEGLEDGERGRLKLALEEELRSPVLPYQSLALSSDDRSSVSAFLIPVEIDPGLEIETRLLEIMQKSVDPELQRLLAERKEFVDENKHQELEEDFWCGAYAELIAFHAESFPFDDTRLKQQKRWPSGVAYFEKTVFVENVCIDDRTEGVQLKGDDDDTDAFVLPDLVRRQLAHWQLHGSNQTARAPGTGARAAEELSRSLPNSLVIKVSASGGFKVYQSGKKIPPP